MTHRTLTGKKKPPIRNPWGRSTSARAVRGRSPIRSVASAAAERGERFGANAGKGSLAALPWALALLGASAVLAAATVLGR